MRRPLLLWLLPLLLALLLHNALAETIYSVYRSKSVKGNDINCNKLDSQGKPAKHCYECGGILAVANKCDAHPDCQGFDMENYDCGYLKSKSSVRQDQMGFLSFCDEEVEGCSSDWVMYVDYDAVTGSDFNCNYKEDGKVMPFCKRGGDVIALMDECDRNDACNAFVVDIIGNGRYGMLKKVRGINGKAERRERKGSMFFVTSTGNPNRRRLQRLGA